MNCRESSKLKTSSVLKSVAEIFQTDVTILLNVFGFFGVIEHFVADESVSTSTSVESLL